MENNTDPPDIASSEVTHQHSPLRGKTILLVNTGSLAKRFTPRRMRELGLRIIALNRERNWADEFVDHWILADTFNAQECIDSIRTFLHQHTDIHIGGAITFWEDDVPLLAQICEAFGFVGNSPEVSLKTRSKFDMQEILRSAGRPAIAQRLLLTTGDLEDAMKYVGFPAIIKPRCGSDSQYVVFVENEQTARAMNEYVRQNCTPEFDPIYHHNNNEFVYQRYIEGPEFSVECFVQHGIPSVVGIHEKTEMELPFFMETGDYCPAGIGLAMYTALADEAIASLRALGVQNSLAHVEVKFTKDGPQIIEVASRMGGVYVYESIRQAHGFDMVKAGCEIALGMEVTDRPSRIPLKQMYAQFLIPRKSGRITRLDGLENVRQHPRVVDFHIAKHVGEYVAVPPEGYESIGWILVDGCTREVAVQAMSHILEKIQIEVCDGDINQKEEKTFTKQHCLAPLVTQS